MTASEFNRIVEDRLKKIRSVLASKAPEYATSERLHNFKTSAKEFGGTPGEAAWDWLKKHLVSIHDMVMGLRPATPANIDEKIGDAINYLILLEALLLEPFIEKTEG
jgi:hypothetical protein